MMKYQLLTVIFLVIHTIPLLDSNRLSTIRTSNELVNLCMKGNHHKSAPSPSNLFGFCHDWSDNSCCTKDTALKLYDQNDNMYRFNMSHCGPLSQKCVNFFKRDHCLYECSPNLGPWLVQESSRKIRDERFYHAPLCSSQCEQWFEACRNDKTCVPNWSSDFKWVKDKGNECPENKTCEPFHQIYQSSKDFCESVWDGSWKVADNDQNCFQLYWKPSESNPNRKVAMDIAEKFLPGSATSYSPFKELIFVLCLLLVVSL